LKKAKTRNQPRARTEIGKTIGIIQIAGSPTSSSG
jgi:hypothetical protein